MTLDDLLNGPEPKPMTGLPPVPPRRRPTPPKKEPLTKGEILARTIIGLCLPLLVVVGVLDVRAWMHQHQDQAATATAVPTLSALPGTTVPTVPRTGAGTSPYLPELTGSPSVTSADAFVPDVTPPVETTPQPTGNIVSATTQAPMKQTVGDSCAGHREGLREYDAQGRLLVCTSGSWQFIQPAGAPVTATPDAASPAAPTAVTPAPRVRPRTSAPRSTPPAPPRPTTTPTTSPAPSPTTAVPTTSSAPPPVSSDTPAPSGASGSESPSYSG